MKLPKELERQCLAMAGEAPAARPKRKRADDPRTAAAARWSVTLVPACRVYSEANTPGHWSVRARRFRRQAESLHAVLVDARLVGIDRGGLAMPGDPGRCVVTLTHVGPRMDDDNLRGAFKGLRDGLALVMRVDDGDARVEWRYDQRPGPAGVEIRIEGGDR